MRLRKNAELQNAAKLAQEVEFPSHNSAFHRLDCLVRRVVKANVQGRVESIEYDDYDQVWTVCVEETAAIGGKVCSTSANFTFDARQPLQGELCRLIDEVSRYVEAAREMWAVHHRAEVAAMRERNQ